MVADENAYLRIGYIKITTPGYKWYNVEYSAK